VNEYHINVFFSAEDGGWIADIPDLDASSAFGRTPVEAVADVERARDAWLAAALPAGSRAVAGRLAPDPQYTPGQA